MPKLHPIKAVIPIVLASAAPVSAQTVTIDPTVQRFIGDVSELDRSKFFILHAGTGDADIQQFYSDYNAYPGRIFWGPFSYANSQTGVVGNYPAPRPDNNTVKPIIEGMVATHHPRDVIRYNLDTNAAADWVVEYYRDFESGSIPEFFEPMNEPFVHADDAVFAEQQPDQALMRQRMAEWFGAIGQAIHQTPELTNMKVVGYSSAWPSMELWDFGHWDSRMKMFMDVAGAHMDAFSTHLYDGINVTGGPNERSGSNSEAILDIIETYSHMKWGVVKDHAITEQGGIAETHVGWNDIEASQSVSSSNKLMFNLLDRADRVAISIPFITDKSTWHLTAENNYEPYGAVLFRPENLGQPNPTGWVYTPKIMFYEMWKDVKGKRIHVHSDHPDIQTHAFLDGNKVYLALNNLDEEAHEVNLSFLSGLSGLQNVRRKELRIYVDAPHEFADTNSTSGPDSITLVADEMVVLEYTFQSNISFGNTIRSTDYHPGKYLQTITANTPISFNFNGVQTGDGTAKLKMGIGREHTTSKQPIITINGTVIPTPTNWKGYDQANRGSFFGTIDIPVPVALLSSLNTVTVEFPDSGGRLSSLILEVDRFDSAPTNQSPYNGVAQQIPGTIEAKDYDLGGQGVAYNDTGSNNNGGLYRSGGVDLGSGDGGVVVGWTAGGEWVEYTVDAYPGTYDLEARVSSGSSGGDIVVTLDGAAVGTFSVPNTGGWATYQTLTLNDVNITGGAGKVLRLTFPTGGLNVKSLTFASEGAFTSNYDVGNPGVAGSTTQSGPEAYTLTGSGSDIWGSADNFQFAYSTTSLSDLEVVTRVDALTNTNQWTKAGVQYRDSDEAGARNVTVVVRPDGQVSMQWRTTNGGNSAWVGTLAGGVGLPKWVRLTKIGNNYTGSWSADGTTWTDIHSVTIAMGNNNLVGLALTSHSNSTLATAEFTNYSVGLPSGTTPPTGLTMLEFRHSSKCIDNEGGTTDGIEYHQWTCDGGSASDINRQFTFNDLGGGYWGIRSEKSNKCLDLANGSTADGAKLHQWACYNSDNQSWKLEGLGGGWFQIVSKKSNKCVDVQSSSTTNGGSILQNACDTSKTSQHLKFR